MSQHGICPGDYKIFDVTKFEGEGAVLLTDRISLGVLIRLFPRDLVDEVIAATGRREQRSRSLPAHVVFYFVLAMALFAEDGYEEVMRRFVGSLRFLRGWSRGWKVPTTSAISQARNRLGQEPLAHMFERIATPIATPGTAGAWFRQFRVMAIDGVVLDAPDTPENNTVFDHSSGGVKESAFPAVRVVGLAGEADLFGDDRRVTLWFDRDPEGRILGWHVTVELTGEAVASPDGHRPRLAGTWADAWALWSAEYDPAGVEGLVVALARVAHDADDVVARSLGALASLVPGGVRHARGH